MFGKKYNKLSTFYKGYITIIGIGIMLFGLFVIRFQTYEHPVYGYMNFGKYHVIIGIFSIIIGAILIIYVRYKAKYEP